MGLLESLQCVQRAAAFEVTHSPLSSIADTVEKILRIGVSSIRLLFDQTI